MTTNTVELAEHIQSLLITNLVALSLADAYYGDQVRVPKTPVACVETGTKTNELNGAPRRVMVTMTVYIIVYTSAVTNQQTQRENDDRMAEAIEEVIHADSTLGGRVIDSMVTAIEFGYAQRGNAIYRSSRLTIEARQQEQLPSSA